MSSYKIHINDRNYSSWSICNTTTFNTETLYEFNPSKHKLFSNDVFTYDKGIVTVIHSSTRINEHIPAVLILADNKTYGREHDKHSAGRTFSRNTLGKLLYKCIPDDKRIPIFLVPYEIKLLAFAKVFTNMYVTIHYKHWEDKHPIGILSQTIGPVNILDNFYEYQLYCKSLTASIQKFSKDTNKAIQTKPSEHDSFITKIYQKYPHVEDRTSWKIFTIDPATGLDFDDAFSIKPINDNQILLSIYIANVTIWMDFLNLWSSFSQRISTIYLPDRKRPMLPTILSDCLCSLQQHMRRFAFVMDIALDEDCSIVSINYSNAIIRVFKNFAYEDYELIANNDYQFLLSTVKTMSKKYRYINNVRDSHEVVNYLMIFMNYHCAQDLYASRTGIFRSTIIKAPIPLPEDLPNEVNQFIKIWNSACAQYINIETIVETDTIKHDILEMDAYIHITSPIRRLVDLLNMIQFQKNHDLILLSPDAMVFYDKWIHELEYINVTMRSIRKVQHDCSLLDACINNPITLDKIYDGYCFDKLVRNDGLYQFIVFLPELKLASKITMRYNLDNYVKRQYKLYLFNDEERFKRKIRLQLVDC
jgi:exoribonuclease R